MKRGCLERLLGRLVSLMSGLVFIGCMEEWISDIIILRWEAPKPRGIQKGYRETKWFRGLVLEKLVTVRMGGRLDHHSYKQQITESHLPRIFKSSGLKSYHPSFSLLYPLPISQFDINTVMLQVCEYFNQFYQTVLKEHIHDAIVHSEWLYFLSMFRTPALDKERIDLYLGILASERNRRDRKAKEAEGSSSVQMAGSTEQPSVQSKGVVDSKGKLMGSGQAELTLTEIKIEKRFSQNWKPSPATLPSKPTKEVKITPEPFLLRKTVSMEDEPNRTLRSVQDQSKTVRVKNQPMYALPSSCSPNSYAYLRPKSTNDMTMERQGKLKERNGKLADISKKLLAALQGVRLRA